MELFGRIALVVLGCLVGLGGWSLGWFALKMILGIVEQGQDRALILCWPLLIVAAFLLLTALCLIAMAFMPSRDNRRGPPRGFMTITRLFDGFWEVVDGITRRL